MGNRKSGAAAARRAKQAVVASRHRAIERALRRQTHGRLIESRHVEAMAEHVAYRLQVQGLPVPSTRTIRRVAERLGMVAKKTSRRNQSVKKGRPPKSPF